MHHLTLMLDTSESNPMMNSDINRLEENLPLIIRWWVIDFIFQKQQKQRNLKKESKKKLGHEAREKEKKTKKKKEKRIPCDLKAEPLTQLPVSGERGTSLGPTPHTSSLKMTFASKAVKGQLCLTVLN